MPRYFFHVHQDGLIYRDEIGQELINVDRAREQAELRAKDLLASFIRDRRWVENEAIEVTTAKGKTVTTVPLKIAMGLTLDDVDAGGARDSEIAIASAVGRKKKISKSG